VRFSGTATTTQAVELEFWTVYDSTETLRPLLADFEAQTGRRIIVNERIFPTLESYRSTLFTELAAGQGPDVFAVHNTWLTDQKKLLTPLPEGVSPSVADVQKEFVLAVPQDVLAPRELAKPDSDLAVYALPMYVDNLALFYNERLLRSYLTKPYPRPASTWEQYTDSNGMRVDGIREEAVRLSVPDLSEGSDEGFRLSAIAMGRADNISRGIELFWLLYLQAGGQGFVNPDTRVSQLGQESRGAVRPGQQALDLLTRFSRNTRYAEYSWGARIGLGRPEKELDAFIRGKVAMVAGYSYYHDDLSKLYNQYKGKQSTVIDLNDVKVAPIPQLVTPSNPNGEMLTIADYFALGVSRTSGHPVESWQLIGYLTSAEVQRAYHASNGRPASRLSLIVEQSSDPVYGVFAEQTRFAVTPPVTEYAKATIALRYTIDTIADGGVQPADALTIFDHYFTCLLAGREPDACLLTLTAQ
jgi:ABC-type glycerol-3-phosphate transport system substrate-binding protein